MNDASIAVGDEFFLDYGGTFRRAKVESLQLDSVDAVSVDCQKGQEVGIRLSVRTKQGIGIMRLALPAREGVAPPASSDDSVPAPEGEAAADVVLTDEADFSQ
jgi:hypothetical protein